ncbi:MAG: hypothetical protein MJE77_37570 [Proteobacteria bacterium]|nr:hypothetical protein [Pseudomonadota bacterium]
MLIAARYLVDRLREPRSRADELLRLRRQLTAQSTTSNATAEERQLALRMRDLRGQIAQALGQVESCAHCARGYAVPEGRWTGGHCCSGNTADLFHHHEIAALTLSGTGSSDLTPPGCDHAGCSFRGPTGCSLSPRHRPNVCIRYLCGELRAELAHRGDLAHVQSLVDDLEQTFDAFVAMRATRLDSEELAALFPA